MPTLELEARSAPPLASFLDACRRDLSTLDEDQLLIASHLVASERARRSGRIDAATYHREHAHWLAGLRQLPPSPPDGGDTAPPT